MNHNFASIPRADIQRSSFNMSRSYKTTLDAGKLIPVFIEEVVPGDTFNLKLTSLARMATPIVPLMDNIYFDTFFFFVPNRLVWNNFEKFMGEREDPDDSIDYLIPSITPPENVEAESVMDYFGWPIGVKPRNKSVLPLRALCLIWNEWFRDENLQDSIKIIKDDSSGIYQSAPFGLDFWKAGSCLPRGKRHDYFTSALPWPQKGESVDIPLGTSAPVVGRSNLFWSRDSSPTVRNRLFVDGNHGKSVMISGADPAAGSGNDYLSYLGGLEVDLTNATAATINTLRQAFSVQRLLERDARGGTRYTEIIRSHFNVVSPDARLQRPEYLGGSSTPFNINPIAQTSSSDDTTPQGNLSAFGLMGNTGHAFTRSFVEHGYIIGLACIRADLNYQQGINRLWSRRTRYDFYWPTLAHLGEQAVFNDEIYCQGTDQDEEVFGYQERYGEMRYGTNLVTGKFRSQYAQPLDSWHLAQKFDSLPALSSDFIIENPPIDRVIAVPSEPQFLLDCYFSISAVRPMPLYGVPGLIDHF